MGLFVIFFAFFFQVQSLYLENCYYLRLLTLDIFELFEVFCLCYNKNVGFFSLVFLHFSWKWTNLKQFKAFEFALSTAK